MKKAGRPRLGLAVLTAAALVGYGLARSPHHPPPELAMNRGERVADHAGQTLKKTALSPNGQRPAITGQRSTLGDTQLPYSPAWVDTEASGSPIDLGEPLDVNDDQGAELAVTQGESVSIGVELDADDPPAWTPEASPEPPTDIGDPLDAEAPDLPVAVESPLQIGPDLDADAPSGWDG